MLDTLVQNKRTSPVAVGLDVDILSIATATPKNKVLQRDLVPHVKAMFPFIADIEEIFAHAGVDARYMCETEEWYSAPHGWEQRTRAFHRHAVDLAEEITRNAVDAADIHLRNIDMVVTSTSTGVGVPGFDMKLLNRLDFSETVERVPLFGLGCGSGLGAMTCAARIAQSMPGANVLCLVVELQSLCFAATNTSIAQLIGGAIFGDGAAGLVLRHSPGSGREPVGRLRAAGERFWRNTEGLTGNEIKDDGFALVLSKNIPKVLAEELRPAVVAFLDQHSLRLEDFDGFLLHPGSTKVLETIEQVLGLARSQVLHSWEVLREYSNMSGPTVLFTLERAVKTGCRGRHLLAALGPGFSAYFAVVDL
jgi:alkylresorcinol/alkylpyrone synthase